MSVEMKPVESSWIAAVGHDPETAELTVELKNGKVYVHAGIAAAEHEALMAADSVGAHYNAHIKEDR